MKQDLVKILPMAMDHTIEGITICDARLPNMPIIFVNKGFCDMTGYEAKEVIGRHCSFLHSSHDDDELPLTLLQGETMQEEILSYKKDGSSFRSKMSIAPVYNCAKELTHFIVIREDITAEKEKEELLREIANKELVVKTSLISEEKQRKEIGEELHDNVNQLLAVTKLYLGIALNSDTRRMEMLEKSKVMLMNAMEEIRKLSKKLTGLDLEKSLRLSLHDLLRTMRNCVTFSIALEFDKDAEDRLTEHRKLAFYRIIQEQLNNIIKHADATAVLICITVLSDTVYLSVKDNGKGFSSDTRDGIGLRNMKSRMEIEEGLFSVNSSKNKGCEIMASFPAEKAEQEIGEHVALVG